MTLDLTGSNIRMMKLAIIGFILASASLTTQFDHAQNAGPLALSKWSYFFVGGKIDSSVEGSPMVGHMYVEYAIPQRMLHPYPIIMVHGGSQHGNEFYWYA